MKQFIMFLGYFSEDVKNFGAINNYYTYLSVSVKTDVKL